MLRMSNRNAGFSLIELMVTVVVLAITLSLAVPAMQELIKNNRVTGQTNELLSMISFARNEALRRNDSVTLIINADNGSWNAEVIDPAGDGAQTCGPGALRCAEHNRVAMGLPDGSSLQLVFNNRGYLATFRPVNLSMEHVGCTLGQSQRRLIVIRPTGQFESCRAQCGANACE